MNSKVRTGKDKQLIGSVKEALGKLAGIDELEATGAREKSIGQAEEERREPALAAKKVRKTKPK